MSADLRPAPKHPLVMSMAIGKYTLPVFHVFVGTLRSSGYEGGITLVISDGLSNEVHAFCSSHVATLRHMREVGMREGHELLHPQFQRFTVYPRLCREPHDACLAVDFRDVFFQADPFATLPLPKESESWLVASYEHPDHTVDTDSVNKLWASVCYGHRSKELAAMRGKHVVCSGSLFGSPAGFAALASAYNRTACHAARDGIDQGVLNALVHAPSQRVLLRGTSVTIQPLVAGQVIGLQGFKGTKVAELLLPPARAHAHLQSHAQGHARSHVHAQRSGLTLPTTSTHVIKHLGLLNASEGIPRRQDTGTPFPVVHQYDRLVNNPWGRSLRFAALERYDRVPCLTSGRSLRPFRFPFFERTPMPPTYGTPRFAGGLIKDVCSAQELAAAQRRWKKSKSNESTT